MDKLLFGISLQSYLFTSIGSKVSEHPGQPETPGNLRTKMEMKVCKSLGCLWKAKWGSRSDEKHGLARPWLPLATSWTERIIKRS